MVRKIWRHHSLRLLFPCILLLMTMGCPSRRGEEPESLGYAPPAAISSLLLRLEPASTPDRIYNSLIAQGTRSSIASYWTGIVLLANGKHGDASRYLVQAQSEGLEPPFAAYCRMALADLELLGGNSSAALARYSGYVVEERDPHLRFMLLSRLTAAAYAAGKSNDADNWLAVLRTEFPHPASSFTSPASVFEKLKADTYSHSRLILQLGIFSSRERAGAVVAEVAKISLTARTVESNGMWVVYLGPYDSKQAAEVDAASLKTIGLHSYVKTWSGR